MNRGMGQTLTYRPRLPTVELAVETMVRVTVRRQMPRIPAITQSRKSATQASDPKTSRKRNLFQGVAYDTDMATAPGQSRPLLSRAVHPTRLGRLYKDTPSSQWLDRSTYRQPATVIACRHGQPHTNSVSSFGMMMAKRPGVVFGGVYLSFDHSLGAAQALAQWARWKTISQSVFRSQDKFV